MATCDVCCEKFNLSTRRKVVCSYCPFNFCRACCSEYVLGAPNDPQCMNCKKPWSREFLADSFTQVWMNTTYKAKRESLLYDRERSLMPATQPYVERESKKRHEATLIEKYTSESTELLKIYNHRNNSRVDDEDMIEKYKELERIDQERAILANKIRWCNHRINLYSGSMGSSDKRRFVRACPANECRGFLSTAWKCGLCEVWVCPECHELKGRDHDAPHTCTPENVETARLLEKDSKPCPSCGSIIFKINGCDQMFCTQCNTAFSWNRGTIEKGRVHNPHYFEFLRQRGGELDREIGDIPCGGVPDPRTFMTRVRKGYLVESDPVIRNIMDAIQGAIHIENVTLYRYRVNQVDDNRDLRIKFMLNDFSEEEFKRHLQLREHGMERKGAIAAVLNTYLVVVAEVVRNFIISTPGPNDFTELTKTYDDLLEIRSFTNEALDRVSKTYKKCAVPKINSRFQAD